MGFRDRLLVGREAEFASHALVSLRAIAGCPFSLGEKVRMRDRLVSLRDGSVKNLSGMPEFRR
jgi:hypothetical protein